MNEANEIMFFSFLSDKKALEEINRQHADLFDALIEAGELDGVAVTDLKVDTLRAGFFAGVEAANRLIRAKAALAMRNQRKRDRTRGEV